MTDRRRHPRIPPDLRDLDRDLDKAQEPELCPTCGGVTSCDSDTCTLEPGRKPYGEHCQCAGLRYTNARPAPCRMCNIGPGKCPEHWTTEVNT